MAKYGKYYGKDSWLVWEPNKNSKILYKTKFQDSFLISWGQFDAYDWPGHRDLLAERLCMMTASRGAIFR